MAALDAGKPLLLDFDSHSPCPPDTHATIVSLRALEDGKDRFETPESRSSRGVIERLWMARRRRNVGVGKEGAFDRVRFPLDGKEKSVRREWRVRRCGFKTVLGLPLLVVVFLYVPLPQPSETLGISSQCHDTPDLGKVFCNM
jgi:hypothetical protein